MSVTAMVITDGRKDCLVPTTGSMYRHLHGPVTEVLIIDDSANPSYARWLDKTFDARIVHHEKRLGFGGAIQSGWDHLGPGEWVFHLEDDFVIQRSVPLVDMIATLAGQPQVVQLVLRRQPVNAEEIAAGGIVERWPTEYIERTGPRGSWLEHRLFFSTNPCLYRRSLTEMGWPKTERSERAFTDLLLSQGLPGVVPEALRFAFWGQRNEAPWVEHIGTERVGLGY